MNKYNIYLWILIMLVTITACRDEYVEPHLIGTLRVEVIDAENYSPLENVRISTSPATSVVLTDASGRVVLDSLTTGSYTVTAKREGYRTELVNGTIDPNATTELVIELSQEEEDVNLSPSVPSNPMPGHGMTDQPADVILSWESTDPDGDSLLFDVILFEQGASGNNVIASDLDSNRLEVSNLKYGTTYYWQVLVKDGEHPAVYGPVWQFERADFPEHRIYFSRKVGNNYGIYCTDLSGNETALPTYPADNWRPHLSPNRSQLAFISNEGIELHLYLSAPDGSGRTNITGNATSPVPLAGNFPLELDYCWSPAGDQLLYAHNDRLYRINMDGSGLTELATAPDGETFVEVDWSGQANRIAVRTMGNLPYESSIYLLEDTGDLTILVDDPEGCIGGPRFSPDGAYILFTHDVSGLEDTGGRRLNNHILLLEIETGQLLDLSEEKPAGTNDLNPQFSPTGAKIIFTNGENDDVAPKNIYVMDFDGTDREMLVMNAEMADWR